MNFICVRFDCSAGYLTVIDCGRPVPEFQQVSSLPSYKPFFPYSLYFLSSTEETAIELNLSSVRMLVLVVECTYGGSTYWVEDSICVRMLVDYSTILI